MAEANHAEENEKLKLVVMDLNRRLKNSSLTIEAERTIARNATAQADLYRQKLGQVSSMLRLESAKSFNIETKNTQKVEAQRFATNKERAGKMHEELRLQEVDHWMTGHKKEPLKLRRMRAAVSALEQEQDSQKRYLQEMTEVDHLNEQLSAAAQMGHLEQCSLLLLGGAWVNYVDAAGYLPMHYACANGWFDVIKLCLEFGADHSSFLTGHSPIVVAASNGQIDVIELLLSCGADIEDRGSKNCPATIAALKHGQYDTFRYLLSDTGADVNSVDADEDTALHVAARIEDRERALEVICFLLERGVAVGRINRRGHTALQVALYAQNKQVAHALGAVYTEAVQGALPPLTALTGAPNSNPNPNFNPNPSNSPSKTQRLSAPITAYAWKRDSSHPAREAGRARAGGGRQGTTPMGTVHRIGTEPKVGSAHLTGRTTLTALSSGRVAAASDEERNGEERGGIMPLPSSAQLQPRHGTGGEIEIGEIEMEAGLVLGGLADSDSVEENVPERPGQGNPPQLDPSGGDPSILLEGPSTSLLEGGGSSVEQAGPLKDLLESQSLVSAVTFESTYGSQELGSSEIGRK